MPSEFDLIQRYFKWPVTETVLLGVGDDAAIIAPTANKVLAVSTDTLVGKQHFFEDTDPYKVGYKSLAVNLSDMAAMGAKPRWVTLSLTLPKSLFVQYENWLSEFAMGFHELAQSYEVALIGGDTTSGPLNINVQIIGEVANDQFLRRDGAVPGDDIWVSGYLGDAALALRHSLQEIELNNEEADYCFSMLHMPTARVELGQRLVGRVHSAIDISDGLMADLGHILACSGQSAVIKIAALPCSQVMKQYLHLPLAAQCQLTGGDDYELCFTAPKKNRRLIEHIANELSVPLTIIGEINQKKEQNKDLIVMDAQGREIIMEKKGYDHFES